MAKLKNVSHQMAYVIHSDNFKIHKFEIQNNKEHLNERCTFLFCI